MEKKKVVLFVLAAMFQIILCGWLGFGEGGISYAGEVPEPTTFLLLSGLGILWLRKANKKNKI